MRRTTVTMWSRLMDIADALPEEDSPKAEAIHNRIAEIENIIAGVEPRKEESPFDVPCLGSLPYPVLRKKFTKFMMDIWCGPGRSLENEEWHSICTNNKIHLLRRMCNLTVKSFAERLGVTEGAVRAWETYRRQPSKPILISMFLMGLQLQDWLKEDK